MFDGVTFTNASEVEIAANGSENITFTADEVGPVIIPAATLTENDFISALDGVVSVSNQASTPGIPKTAYTQDYTTASGQIIPIKYDIASNTPVFVKIYIQAGAETGDQITNQLKKDLIKSSASWQIGESITSLITSVPFDGCNYTTVAYCLVSDDGETWKNIVDVPANSIPRVSDETISVEVLSE